MLYYNASQASRELNVPDKTVRRWLKQGLSGRWQLTAVRTESGQLAIASSDIERIKRGREQDRAQFAKPSPASPGPQTPSPDKGDMPRQVQSLTKKVGELERKVAELEYALSRQISPSPDDQKPLGMSSQSLPSRPSTPSPRPQIRTTDVPANTLSASDFAKLHGIKYDTMKDYIRRGVNGEQLGVTEVPHPVRANYTQKYLTVEQQQRALELLKRHGKL